MVASADPRGSVIGTRGGSASDADSTRRATRRWIERDPEQVPRDARARGLGRARIREPRLSLQRIGTIATP